VDPHVHASCGLQFARWQSSLVRRYSLIEFYNRVVRGSGAFPSLILYSYFFLLWTLCFHFYFLFWTIRFRYHLYKLSPPILSREFSQLFVYLSALCLETLIYAFSPFFREELLVIVFHTRNSINACVSIGFVEHRLWLQDGTASLKIGFVLFA